MKRILIWFSLSLLALAMVSFALVRSTHAQDNSSENSKTGLESQPPYGAPQPPGGPPPVPGSPQPPGGFVQPRPGGPPPGGFQPMMGNAPIEMVVSGDSVYVLRGNRIYRLDAKSLEVKATGQLPNEAPPRPASPPNE